MNHQKFISIFLLLSFVNIHNAYSQNFFTQKANNLISASNNTQKVNSAQSINLTPATPPVNNIPSINTNALKTQTAICEKNKADIKTPVLYSSKTKQPVQQKVINVTNIVNNINNTI